MQSADLPRHPVPSQRCHFYARGTCKNGLACPYSHKPSTRRKEKDSSKSIDGSSSIESSKSTSTSPCQDGKGVNGPPTRRHERVRCWYFLYGQCKFGNKCINSHELPSQVQVKVVSLDEDQTTKMSKHTSPRPVYARPALVSLLSGLEGVYKRRCPGGSVPGTVTSIDEAFSLDFENDKRMLGYLTHDLRQFVEG